jgi:hypothetical protein
MQRSTRSTATSIRMTKYAGNKMRKQGWMTGRVILKSLDIRIHYFNCANALLMLSKFGIWPGSSLDSA